MKKALTIAVVALGLGITSSRADVAFSTSFGSSHHAPRHCYTPPPVVCAPAPVVYTPAPVVYAPAPVVYTPAPQPVYAPVYTAPVVVHQPVYVSRPYSCGPRYSSWHGGWSHRRW